VECGAGINIAELSSRHTVVLITHCGIEWTKINGTYWRAVHPLSDGNGNRL
jgi:hypothetical protein